MADQQENNSLGHLEEEDGADQVQQHPHQLQNQIVEDGDLPDRTNSISAPPMVNQLQEDNMLFAAPYPNDPNMMSQLGPHGAYQGQIPTNYAQMQQPYPPHGYQMDSFVPPNREQLPYGGMEAMPNYQQDGQQMPPNFPHRFSPQMQEEAWRRQPQVYPRPHPHPNSYPYKPNYENEEDERVLPGSQLSSHGPWSPLPMHRNPLGPKQILDDDDDSIEHQLLPDLSSDSESMVVPGVGNEYAEAHLSELQEQYLHRGPPDMEYGRFLWETHDVKQDMYAKRNPFGPNMHNQMAKPPMPMHNSNMPRPMDMYAYQRHMNPQQVPMQHEMHQIDMPPSPDMHANQPICRYYIQGYCSRGDRCNYLHMRDQYHPGTMRKEDKHLKKQMQRMPKRSPMRPNQPMAPPAPLAAAKKPIPDPEYLANRYTTIEQAVGKVYAMCKDQHGCRFLQKKLEEQNPRTVEIIFNEVFEHIVELMTDPFGNYLCQKLLEHCNDKQRLVIVQEVAPNLVSISKNMHGTRAVQKMIECLSSPAQVQLVVNALKSSVVQLIQDLNGNHVIQRCLNRLSSTDNQFVYDAVAGNCVEVATHRHGCCVMQRCIDHASDSQKMQLVKQITNHSLALVRDPFGNYVVQYVLDLPYPQLKHDLITHFYGHLTTLSTQKFSSNVIEKCLKTAGAPSRRGLIDELIKGNTLSELLRDPYGNYVVQTGLSVADMSQRQRLVEAIKPLLPELRNTPYGKRIQNKIMKLEPHQQL